VSAREIIDQIKVLPPRERAEVERFIQEDDSWIPESFKTGMKDIVEGRVVDMETALHEPPPSQR
jgi:hypothetical protein